MTLDDVRAKVAELAELARVGGYDPEASHGSTDGLYIGVLRAVAAEDPDGVAMAAEALKVEDLDLTRWYA